MAKRVQRRRGTTTEHASFTGYIGESTVDTTKDTVVVHDGSQLGGFPLAREDLSNVTLTNLIGITELKLSDGTANQVIQTDGSGTISFGTIDIAGATIGAVGGDIEGTIANAQIKANVVGIAEINVTDGTSGQALITNGSGTLSFGDVLTDPALGGHLSGTTSNATIRDDTITSGMLTTALKNFTVDEFVGAAAQTTFTLTAAVGSVNALLVYVDGIVQPTTAYSLPSTTSIQFTVAPPVSAVIRCLHLGFQSTVGVPSDGAVTTAKLAANAVTSAKILDGTIATGDIADDAITEAKIYAQTITNASILPGTIRSQEIANATITGTDMAANSIDGTKIALGGDAQGDVMYYDGTNWARLGPGTANYVLKTAGASANPSWVDPGTLGGVGKVIKISQVRNTAHLTWSNNNGWAVADAFAWADGGVATSLAYTGIATTNRLQITAYATFIANATGYGAIGLFSTQTLLGTARKQNHAGGKGYGPSPIFTDIPVPSTSAVTYTLRFVGEGGTVYLNTDNGLNNPVGGESCGIMITEYTP